MPACLQLRFWRSPIRRLRAGSSGIALRRRQVSPRTQRISRLGHQAKAVPPGGSIGILGSGQLGRMLALAAGKLGLKTHVYCDASGPAFDVSTARSTGSFNDREALARFAATVDAVTYEFENIPLETVTFPRSHCASAARAESASLRAGSP